MADAHDHLRGTDLGPLVEEYGDLELDPSDDLFERLVVSIVKQLISTDDAQAIVARLREEYEITPEAMLAADEAELRDLGLSGQKVGYVRNAAEWWADNDPGRERFESASGEEVVSTLTEISGVGDWTAEMVLMLGLGREDVLPLDDLALRNAFELVFGDEDRAAMRDRAEPWRPYRSYATLYLWTRYVDEELAMDVEELAV